MSVLDQTGIVETGGKAEHTFETYLEHGRNISQARSIYTSSTVETIIEHGRNTHQAQSRLTSSTVKKYQLQTNIPKEV